MSAERCVTAAHDPVGPRVRLPAACKEEKGHEEMLMWCLRASKNGEVKCCDIWKYSVVSEVWGGLQREERK